MALGEIPLTTTRRPKLMWFSNSATTAAVAAGTVAAAAYVDAKFHIRKDVEVLVSLKKLEREYIQAGKILFFRSFCYPLLTFPCSI